MAIGRPPTHNPKALPQPVLPASSFLSQPCSPGSRSAPQQAQRRRFTAHGSVSLCRCPCFPATHHRPNPIATYQFVPPENLPTPRPSQHLNLLSKPADHRSRHRCRPRSSSSVTSVPPATLPLLFANPIDPQKIPPSAAEWKTDAQHNPKRLPQPVLQACSCLSFLQPRQPQPPRSRRSAAVSLHKVPFHFGAAPAFLPCFRQRNRFPRPGLSHPFEEFLHHPTHPFQRCEKQPQCPQPSAGCKLLLPALQVSISQHPPPRSRSSRSHFTSHGCVHGYGYPCFHAQTRQRQAVFHGVVCPLLTHENHLY